MLESLEANLMQIFFFSLSLLRGNLTKDNIMVVSHKSTPFYDVDCHECDGYVINQNWVELCSW